MLAVYDVDVGCSIPDERPPYRLPPFKLKIQRVELAYVLRIGAVGVLGMCGFYRRFVPDFAVVAGSATTAKS